MGAPGKQRLSLVDRQQLLLEEKGFSKPASGHGSPTGQASKTAQSQSSPTFNGGASSEADSSAPSPTGQRAGPSHSFIDRQEALLVKTGRGNAARNSRIASVVDSQNHDDVGLDDTNSNAGSVASRVSKAPSMHPSVGQYSVGLSESSIGAGDDTVYWDFQHRKVERKDLGHKCHECKIAFSRIGDPLTERRGARISMRYHAECFSGFADPRSQSRSSHYEGRLAGTQMCAAPAQKTSKMRTSTHFEGGRLADGKLGMQLGMGHHGFGNRSSKGVAPKRAPGGFTEGQLAAHDRQMETVHEDT